MLGCPAVAKYLPMYPQKLPITLLPIAGERVFIRCDFNVPLDLTSGAVSNPARIVAALPSVL